MKARGCLAVLVCALAAMLPAAGASAKPGYFVSSHFHYAKVHLQGSNGYHLEIQGYPSNVEVNAKKRNERVSYSSSSGRLRDDRIRATLPGIGRVDLRFHEQSRSRENPADNCLGPGELVRRGVFRGRVRIAGERGYTYVDVRSARGKISDDPEQICRRGDRGKSSGAAQEELLQAAGARGRGTLSFFANEWPPFFGSRPVFFFANLARRRGKMLITNSVEGFTEDPKSVILDRPPLSGTVVPPRPFTGTARFQREPDGSFTWLGDLAAELPGIGPVALAGPGFEASACVNRTCKGSSELRFW